MEYKQEDGIRATSGNRMGPVDTHRSPCLSPAHKKALSFSPDSHKKAFPISHNYPTVDEGVLRIWGLRQFENGVIGWEVGMGKA